MFQIAGNIALEFVTPIIRVGFRLPGNPTGRILVLMPKAAMNENYFAAGTEDEIRFGGKILIMQPIAVSEPVD